MLLADVRAFAFGPTGRPLSQLGLGHAKRSSFALGATPERAVTAVSAPTKKDDRLAGRPRILTSPEQEPEAGPVTAWTLDEYQKLFRNYLSEEEYKVTDVEGHLPTDLEGTFYRNGPGITELGGQKMHCFDGHGLIARVTIRDGTASFKSRYVRTQVFEEEMKANKVLYRGFGSTKPGGFFQNALDIRDKPVANTSILEWGGNLYALWEAHNPYLLDPATLETLGEETFDGALPGEQPFTAHPAFDRHTGRLVAFSNGIRHGEGKLHIWELDTDNKIRKSITHTVGLLPVLYLHDFRVTKNWYIFHQAPLGLNAGNAVRYLLGGCEQTQQVFFDKSMRGKWWLVPRNGGKPQLVESEPLMIWHYGNAFEDEATGKVTVDACAMDEFSFGGFDMRKPDTIPTSEVARFEIDPAQGVSTRRTLMAHSADFPQVNPLFQGDPGYRFLYTAASMDNEASFPFRRVIKLDVQSRQKTSWLAPPGCFVGEPIYVPRKLGNGAAGEASAPLEDDGYVVVLVSDARAEQSRLCIFRAADLSSGPVCQIHLKKLLPMAFHCAWSASAFG